MYIISKTIKGKEYLYSKKHTILCKTEKQAIMLANFLNNNNEKSIDSFKLKDSEIWHTYEIDKYSMPPMYELKSTKNSITIKEFIDNKGLFVL